MTTPAHDANDRALSAAPPSLAWLLVPPQRRRVIVVIAGSALAGFAAWLIGMDTGHAAIVGVVFVALGLVWIGVPVAPGLDWELEQRTVREGTRSNVVELSWSLQARRRGVQQSALRRVQVLATDRLARHRLDLRNPADRAEIERLLGARAYATLQPPTRGLPKLRDLVECLDRLDDLDPDRTGLTAGSRAGPWPAATTNQFTDLLRKVTRYDRWPVGAADRAAARRRDHPPQPVGARTGRHRGRGDE